MTTLLTVVLVLADESSGTAGSPSKLGGIAIIVGSVLAAAAVIAIVWWLTARMTRRNQRTTAEREPHEPGQVGRL